MGNTVIRAATLAAAAWFALAPAVAQHYRVYPEPPGMLMSPITALRLVRAMGFDPVERPALYGSTYVVRAFDDFAFPVRVVLDARSGALVSVSRNGMFRPRYGALLPGPGARTGYDPHYNETPVMPPRSLPRLGGRAGPNLPGDRFSPPSAPDIRQAARTPAHAPLPRARPAGAPTSEQPVAAAPASGSTPGKSIPAPVASRAMNSAAPPGSPPAGGNGLLPAAPLD